MKSFFKGNNQKSLNQQPRKQPIAIELDEQELRQVNGGLIPGSGSGITDHDRHLYHLIHLNHLKRHKHKH
ncbi:MAG: class IIb bacteriocin, lactobin A/cerein 7B family [Ktedonobacteraceae bacterium]|nr:class IIb bacteriocin, lactobin A/cerein 7B family [Ktedonobacteraceae bacterium]MBO0793593.1 class IIb bacteriocin, lactobin A/cerein 7B family [Ktedonobacteraceae bacterium]